MKKLLTILCMPIIGFCAALVMSNMKCSSTTNVNDTILTPRIGSLRHPECIRTHHHRRQYVKYGEHDVKNNKHEEKAESKITDNYTMGDYTWTYSTLTSNLHSNRKVVVTAVRPSPSGILRIPSRLGTYSVTKIGAEIFAGCTGITSVVIPEGVTDIGYKAFSDCSGITNITIPSSVTDIDWRAFSNCSGLTSVRIPDNSAMRIGDRAFYECRGITNVIIGNNGAAGIWPSAFSGCSRLTNLVLPDSLTSIGVGTFDDCGSIMSVTVPQCVCSSRINVIFPSAHKTIRSVEILNGTTNIGTQAFYYCSGLESVKIPNSTTTIGDLAFLGCNSLTNMIIPNGVTSIGREAFRSCHGLTRITIPNSITNIGVDAFLYCDSFMNVTIPRYVCSSRMSVMFPSSYKTIISVKILYGTTNIGSQLFSECRSLTNVSIPESVKDIGERAFENCNSLTSVTIPISVTNIGCAAFSNCSSLKNVTIPDNVTNVGNSAFYGCRGLTSIFIPTSVTSINCSVFSGCTSLTNISVEIGNAKYSSRNGLLISKDGKTLIHGANGDVTIPDGVTSIGSFAFCDLSGLTSITIPDGVTNIGSNAFYRCSNLRSVTIPDSVTNIESSAFYGCSGLKSVTIPTTTNIDSSSFPKDSVLVRAERPKTSPEIHTEVLQNKDVARKKVVRSVMPLSKTNNASEVFEHVKECLVMIKTGDLSGSGFIAEIDGKAWLITNEHVVRSGAPIVATKLNGQKLTITSMQIAGTRDLVRMEVEEADVALPLADRTKIGMGKKIFVFGDSDGRGVFTTLSGEIIGVGPDQIEISAEIISGNSGSAIINEYGEVIGVATYAVNSSPKDWVKKDTRFSKVRRFGLLLNNYEWENVTLELYQKQSSAYNELLEFATIWAPNLCFKLTTGKGFHVESFNPSEFCILRQKLETIVSADEALVCEFEECKSFAKTFNNKYELQKAWNNAVATRKSILDKIGKCYTVRKDAIETGQKLANNSYAIERIEEDIKDIRDFFQYAVLELKNTYDDFHKLWRQYKYSAIPFMD